MLGRRNKDLIIRLIQITPKPTYHIIVTRKRSKATSRLDCIGYVKPRTNIAYIRLDITKLTKYLVQKNVKLSATFWKVLNLDLSILLGQQKTHKTFYQVISKKKVIS
jgi:ribosomal protein S16